MTFVPNSLLIGATARLTRLLTTDGLMEPVRSMIERRSKRSRVAEFIQCDWCVSFWIGLVVFAASRIRLLRPATFVVSGALTSSLVAGWLAKLEMERSEVWVEEDIEDTTAEGS